MKKLKIILSDPRHSTVGLHSNYVPIGIGYIASYLYYKFPNDQLEIKLTTEINETLELIENWQPDIIGCSNYVWNAKASNFICEFAKKINKNILCILGGPEFPAGTGQRKIENNHLDNTYDKCLKYLKFRPCVDYFVYTDGEVAFIEILNTYLKNQRSIKVMKQLDKPIDGCASLSKDKSKLLIGGYVDRIGMFGSIKENGRDIIPSPYTTGLLDKFLNGKFIPAFETSRGCPFLCAFCDQGLDMSKITTFSTKRMSEEIAYVGKKISNVNDGTKKISIFDSNWGMYQKDVDLAYKILDTMNKYDWPEYIECLTPKSNRENLLKINDILKNRVALQLSMQSLNDNVLNLVKRKNWTISQYLDFLEEIKKRGKSSTSEMIIPLPGETETSYHDGTKFLMDNGIQPITYTLMMLCGAEYGRDSAIKKHELKPMYRVLPKQFGEYRGTRLIETEKVCVGTKDMSFENYMNCRNYSYILKILSSSVLHPVYLLTQKLSISWYEFSKEFSDFVKSKECEGKFKDVYNGFCKESLGELFSSREETVDFYSKTENYEALIKGEIGENLLVKYIVKGLIEFNDLIEKIFFVFKDRFKETLNTEAYLILNSAEKWIKNIYMISDILIFNKNFKIENTKVDLDYDIPEWLKNNNINDSIKKKRATYFVKSDKNKLIHITNEMKTISDDVERSLGRFIERTGRRDFSYFQKNYS
tara:strand:- start:2769 stop:4877 length:2109 start_codon:yes stop_codon:yes gene_type:complete